MRDKKNNYSCVIFQSKKKIQVRIPDKIEEWDHSQK